MLIILLYIIFSLYSTILIINNMKLTSNIMSSIFFSVHIQASAQVWEVLMKRVLRNQYTASQGDLIRLITESTQSKLKLFTIRYVFQSTIHTIWRERNQRRHEEYPLPVALLIKKIDKNWNKFTIIQKKGDVTFEEGMTYWFDTR